MNKHLLFSLFTTRAGDLKCPKFSKDLDLITLFWRNHYYKGVKTINYKCKCRSCSETKNYDEMVEITNIKYEIICRECVERLEQFSKCPHCNNWFHRGNSGGMCNCIRSKTPKFINRYNSKIAPKYYKANKSDYILFGIELEVEFGDSASGLNDMTDVDRKQWLYFKHDGTIGNGVEIVTHPLGWKWINKNKKEFDPIFDLARKGMKSRHTNTCGMHVHLSKNLFSTLHVYKFMLFFHRNIPYTIYISERLYDDLQRWSYYYEGDRDNLMHIAHRKYGNERHAAINLENPETVEVRIFKGTLSPVTFFKNIEFVKAVFDFTKDASVSQLSKRDSEEEFETYVKTNSKEFPNLVKFINLKKR